jgi:probable phosphoglycerate mutase
MELVLVRHAEPFRIDDTGGGPADPALTDRGRDQAERLTRWLEVEHFDALWVSPLRRARETAAPLADALGLEPVVDDDLAEWDRASGTYIPIEDLRASNDPAWFALVEGRWEEFFGVDPALFRRTVIAVMDRIVAAHRSHRVAVVCHGGVLNAYIGHVLGIDRPLWYDPAYTSINRVVAAPSGVRSLGSLNETPHLR